MDSSPPATMIRARARQNLIAGQHDGAHGRAAHLVDRGAGDARRDAGAEGGLPGRGLAEAGGEHAAHDHFIDIGGGELRSPRARP